MSYRYSAYSRRGKGLYVFLIILVVLAIAGIFAAALLIKGNGKSNDDDGLLNYTQWNLTLNANSYKTGENLLNQNDAVLGYDFQFLPNGFTDNAFLRFKVTYNVQGTTNHNLVKYLNNMAQNLTFITNENYSFNYNKDGYYYLTDSQGNPTALSYVKSYYYGKYNLFDSSNIIVPENAINLPADDYNKTLAITLKFEAIATDDYNQNKNLSAFANIHNYFLNSFNGTELPLQIEDKTLVTYVAPTFEDADGNEYEYTNVEFTLSSTYKMGEILEDGTSKILTGNDLFIYEIAENAFKDKTNVKINLGDLTYIEKIGDNAFYNCTKLNGNLTLTNCNYIGNYSFSSCSNLNGSVNLENCITIGDHCFASSAISGALTFNKAETISQYAFLSCGNITALYFNNINKTTIDVHCFNGLNNITTLNLENITEVAGASFANCTKLKTVYLPSTITSLPMSAFNNCTSLTTVNASNLQNIGHSSFEGCTSLKNIDFSKIIGISTNGFENCTSLTGIINLTNATSIGTNAFFNCTGITGFKIKTGCTLKADWNKNSSNNIQYV